MEVAWGGVWLPIRSADRRSWAGSVGALGVAGVSRNAMPPSGAGLNTRKRKQLTAATFGYSFGYRPPTKKYFAPRVRLPEVRCRTEYDSPENFRRSLRVSGNSAKRQTHCHCHHQSQLTVRQLEHTVLVSLHEPSHSHVERVSYAFNRIEPCVTNCS